MKKFLSYIFIVIVLVSSFVPTNEVFAQLPTDLGTCTTAGLPPDIPDTFETNVQRSTCTGFGKSFQANSPSGNPPATDPEAVKTGLSDTAGKCSVWSGPGLWNCLGWVGARLAYYTVLKVAAWIVWFAGILLDFVLDWTIIDMKENLGKMTGINVAWKIIRDIMNIAFIFLLVYEGIKIIIDQSDLTKVKKFVSMIVLASLLINFSLFFTKVLIDASNVVTIGLYNSTITNSEAVLGGDQTGGAKKVGGLSAPFMNSIGVTGFYSNETFDQISSRVDGDGNMMIFFILGAVVLLIMAFVFFAVACLFAIRYVTLIILLMLSPVAYMGMALPFMSKYSKDWWNALNSQLLFAPIYMMMTVIVLALISADGFLMRTGDIAGLVGGDGKSSGINLLFNFFVVIALAIASLVIAKKTSVEGSAHIKDVTNKFTAFAGGAMLGGVGRVGRTSLGRLGNRWANDKDLQDRAADGSLSARMRLATANKMAKSSFDVRATKGFGNLSKQSDLSFGKVDIKKENFQSIREEQNKKLAENMKLYKPSTDSEDRAKTILESANFKSQEEKAKKDYLESDEYKNAEVYKKALQAEKDTERLKKTIEETKENDKKIEVLRKREDNLAKNGGSLVEADKINKEILEIEEDTRNKQESIKKLQELDGERKTAIKERDDTERTWMSETMKSLIAQKGGQEKKEKDGKLIQAEVVGLYQDRLNRIARREGHEDSTNTQLGMRIGANTVGTILNALGVTSMPKTKTDRTDLARKIRGLGKAKKPKEEFEELLKKAGIVEEPKEETKAPEPEPKPDATK